MLALRWYWRVYVAPLRDLGGVAVKELTGWYVSPSGTDLAMRCCMKARLF
jgi:hypothetical protein